MAVDDEAEAKRLRKAAKKAAAELEAEVDEVEAKRQRKAAKKAAKAAAVEAEVQEEPEVDEAEAKRQRKAAKKAAKAAVAAAEEVQEEPEVDEAEAKKRRKAEKKAAKAAALAEAEDEPEIDAKKAKKRSVEPEDQDLEEAVTKKSKTETPQAETEEKPIFKVFIKGLPYSVNKGKLEKDFAECGEIAEVRFPLADDGSPKGFAFITFATKAGFDAALAWDSCDYGGRQINVMESTGQGKGNDGKGKSKGKGKDGDWECPKCGDNVFARNAACRQCGTERPGGAPSAVSYDHENTVFIRGLPWAVEEETLRTDFAECGEIENLRLPMNAEGRPAGIAFIKFKTQEGVEAALKYDNTDYGGRNIGVMKSGEGMSKGKGKGKDKGKDKGNDGKGKKGKGKSKAPSESFAKRSGAIVAGAGEKTTFADSDDDE